MNPSGSESFQCAVCAAAARTGARNSRGPRWHTQVPFAAQRSEGGGPCGNLSRGREVAPVLTVCCMNVLRGVKLRRSVQIGFAASLLCACGPSEATGSSSSAVTSLPVALQSASGALQVVLNGTPSPPALGEDTFEMAITNSDGGAPVTGLTLTVVPWMPAMGHGTSTVPTVSESPPGTYVISNVDFFMAGVWELRTAISGPVTDNVTPSFNIP